MTDQRSELIQSYLRVAPQLSDEESEAIEKIRIILADHRVGPLAKQRLALQLINEVSSFLEVDLCR